MAVKIIIRHDTVSNWELYDPTLSLGEIGIETDTLSIKVGDGQTIWSELSYATASPAVVQSMIDSAVAGVIDLAPGTLDTLNELAAAINDDPNFFSTIATSLGTKQDKVTGVSDTEIGYLDGVTSAIQTQLNSKANSADIAELAQDAIGAAIAAGTQSNITVTYDDATNSLSFAAENGVADSTTDNLTEGTTNKYFTNERAQDAVGNNVGNGLTYDDPSATISVKLGTGVEFDGSGNIKITSAVTTNSGEQTLTNKTIDTADNDIIVVAADISDVTATATELNYVDGVTSSIQTQLDSKAPTSSPTFTGTVSGITKGMVGLGNVDNTSDVNKPISTATQTALNAKAATSELSAHETATTNVHGITDTAELETKTGAQNRANTAENNANNYTDGEITSLSNTFSDHVDATTDVHGIADTAELETQTGAQSKADAAESNAAAYTDTAISNLIDTAPSTLNTLNELAAALGDDPNFATSIATTLGGKLSFVVDTEANFTENNIVCAANTLYVDAAGGLGRAKLGNGVAHYNDLLFIGEYSALDLVNQHNSTEENVHGISNTANLAYQSDVSAVAGDLTTHASLTTNVHGIADTADLLVTADLTSHTEDTLNVHGIVDTSDLVVSADIANFVTQDELSSHSQETQNVHGIADTTELVTQTDLSSHAGDTTNIHGIVDTSDLVVSADLLPYATLNSPEFSGIVVLPTTTSIGSVTGAEIATLANAASELQTQIDGKLSSSVAESTYAPLNSPTFTGSVSLPADTTINNVSAAEIGYLANVTSDVQTQLNSKAPIASPTFTGTVSGITQSMVGLANVDNTSDANKPISTATQAALDLKAPIADPTFTGTVSGITKSMVGLGNVNNTSDANKPVSSAQQSALDLKANLDTPTFTGTVVLPETTSIGSVSSIEISYLDGVTSSVQTQINSKLASSTASSIYAPLANPTFTGTVAGITKSMVGLGNVDNTSDADKPISSATQAALDLKSPSANPTFTGTVSLPGTTSIGNVSATEIGYVDGVTSSIQSQLNAKADTDSPTLTGTVVLPSTTSIGNVSSTEIGYVDGVTSSIQTQLDAKAPIDSPTFTGTVSGITKAMVGLNNVNNTADANKPVSTAQQAALDLKADLAGPAFTGTVTAEAVTISGNLTVSGTTTTVNTQTLAVEDNLIYLNAELDRSILGATHNTTTVEYQVDSISGITAGESVRVTGVTPSNYNIASSDNITVNSVRTSGNRYYFTVTKTVSVSYTSGGTAHFKKSVNTDLGIAGGYNDGSYAHAGVFRDATDGKWKFFQGYTPEPDEAVDIDTSHASFALAPISVASIEATSAAIGNVSNTEIQYLDGVTSAIQTQIDAKANIASPTFTGTVAGITKSMVGLANVDNTSDANKPVSSATQTALDLKAPLANPTFTGTVSGITKSMVGLGSVDNTSDASKPISTATQTALDLKAPLASPTFTGTVTLPTGTVTSGMILDGTIVNSDISDTAAIAATKISGTAITAADTGTVTSTMILDGTIVNADINVSAAIAATKISGTAVTQADTGTVTSAMIANGTIVDGDISNSAAIAVSKLAANTISGKTLGNNLDALTIGTGLSGTSYNGSSAVTIAIDSTVATLSGTQSLTNKTVTFAAGGATFSDGTTQVTAGVPSLTTIKSAISTSVALSALTSPLTYRDALTPITGTVDITVDADGTNGVTFPIGTSIDFYQDSGTGAKFVQGSGVTLKVTPGLKFRTTYSSATITKVAANTWLVYGDLSA
jgi:hypothetical protein